MTSWALRQRLGFTVSGAGLSSEMKALKLSMSQTGAPFALVMRKVSGLAMKPRAAFSKSSRSPKLRLSSTLRLAALVASVAGFGAA